MSHRIPTKAEEIAILDEAISKLGTNSYLGPWLKEVREDANSLMRGDIYPSVLISDSIARSERSFLEATAKAKEIVSAANLEAKRIVDGAKEEAKFQKQSARRALEECSARL